MTSPAWRFKERCDREAEAARLRAAAAAADAAALDEIADNAGKFDLLVAGIEADCKRISALPQGVARIPEKRRCCEVYDPFLDRYLADGSSYRNPVLVQVMIWRFDAGDIERAMELARVAIAQRQPMPERFGVKTTVDVFVADAVLEWSRYQRAAGSAISPYFDTVFEQLDTLALHDAQRVKYCKIALERAMDEQDFTAALELCDRALSYDPAATVKTVRAKIEKELDKLAEAAKFNTPAGGAAGTDGDTASPDAPAGDGAPPASYQDDGK